MSTKTYETVDIMRGLEAIQTANQAVSEFIRRLKRSVEKKSELDTQMLQKLRRVSCNVDRKKFFVTLERVAQFHSPSSSRTTTQRSSILEEISDLCRKPARGRRNPNGRKPR